MRKSLICFAHLVKKYILSDRKLTKQIKCKIGCIIFIRSTQKVVSHVKRFEKFGIKKRADSARP